jgi:hypothetical protein
MRKFLGTILELKAVVTTLNDTHGYWIDERNWHQYRASNGAILNWWHTTKTLSFQGPSSAADDLERAFSACTETMMKHHTLVDQRHGFGEVDVVDADYVVVDEPADPWSLQGGRDIVPATRSDPARRAPQGRRPGRHRR